MKTYQSVARDRGVTTIPADLREQGALEHDTELTWIALEPQLWLVGPRARHPERLASTVAAAIVGPSPFPKLMQHLAQQSIAQRDLAQRQAGAPMLSPALSEEQMIALGAPVTVARRRRRRAE